MTLITKTKLKELREMHSKVIHTQEFPSRCGYCQAYETLEKTLAVVEAANAVIPLLACGGPKMRPCSCCDLKEALAPFLEHEEERNG